MNQVDDILVIKNNQIIEQGSYSQLIAKKGHLANLLGEHLELFDPLEEVDDETVTTEELNLKYIPSHRKVSTQDLIPSSRRLSSIVENLTPEQILNRKRFSITTHSHTTTEDNLAKIIESHQVNLMGSEPFSRKNSLSVIERNRVSIVSGLISEPEYEYESTEPKNEVKQDAEAPMKLVLEDQSVNYKKSPILSYLQAGSGIIITLVIFAYFFWFILFVYSAIIGYLNGLLNQLVNIRK